MRGSSEPPSCNRLCLLLCNKEAATSQNVQGVCLMFTYSSVVHNNYQHMPANACRVTISRYGSGFIDSDENIIIIIIIRIIIIIAIIISKFA